MQAGDNHYLKGVNFQLNTKPTGDLKTNFDKILPIIKQTLADQLNEADNLQFYPNAPGVPDAHIIGMSLLQEALSIDSEHLFGSKLQADYAEDFPDLPHLTNLQPPPQTSGRLHRAAGPHVGGGPCGRMRTALSLI